MARRATGGVEIEGLTRIVRDLQQVGLEVDDLKDAFATISREAADSVADRVPERTGRAKATVRGNRAKSKAVVRAGTAAVPYLGAINYGWPARNIAPAEFMQKGEQAYIPKAVDRLTEEIEATITKKGLR